MRLNEDFYTQDALLVASNLIGKLLVRKLPTSEIIKKRITETEAYLDHTDTASHARFGKTERNKIMYQQGGYSYVYLCYGIHYLFNVVSGIENSAQAVLIRGVEGFNGPGKMTKIMRIDKNLNGVNLMISDQIWIEDDGYKAKCKTTKRIGIDYATDEYRNKKWRFIME